MTYSAAVRSARQPPQRDVRVLVAAAVLTVIATVVADALAGQPQWHVATIGAIATVVAVLRVRMTGDCRRLHQLVSGVVVAQPAVHAAAKLVPHGPVDQDLLHQLVHGDVFVLIAQMIIASAFVAVVSFSEQFVRAVLGVVRVARVRIRVVESPTQEPTPSVRRAPEHARLDRRYRPGVIARRGPPHRFAMGA